MKLKELIIILQFLFVVHINCIQSIENKPNLDEIRSQNTMPRAGRAGIIAFKPFGEDVHVGLDLLLPFVKVPTKRQLNDGVNNEALLTVNTAAVTIGGLLSGIGIFIGHILRSLITLRGREDSDASKPDVETRSHSVEHRLDFDAEGNRFARMLEPIKLLYRNSSGDRVDTSLAELIHIVEINFLENDIDLSACMQKALCSLVQRANMNMVNGVANGIEKMIDGLLQMNWILQLAHNTAVADAILAGKSNSTEQCFFKFRKCKWEAPEEQLYELVKKHVKFI